MDDFRRWHGVEAVLPRRIEALPHVAEHVLGMMLATSSRGAAAALRGRAERPDYVEMPHERILDATPAVVDGAVHLPELER